MKTVGIVFRKELLDTIRDRRSIVMMIVIPMFLFPVIFKTMIAVTRTVQQKASEQTLTVAVALHRNSERIVEIIEGEKLMKLVPDVPPDSIRSFVTSGKIDAGFILDENFDEREAANQPGRIDFYYKAVDEEVTRDRLLEIVDKYEEELLAARFERMSLDRKVVDGVDLRKHNIASTKEKIGKQVGGFLPYIFIIFCFMGAMYPAIDLGAGEKERGTLETLLTAPVNRYHILLGKLGVVVTSGILSALVSITSLYVSVRQIGDIPPELMSTVIKILGPGNVALVISLLLPLTVFFGGVLLSLSFLARSFKEAQSMVTPANFMVIIPAAIGTIPGIKLTYATALIPVLNVSLATKEIIAGTASQPHLVIVYAWLILLALGSMTIAARQFNRESAIFRA